MSDTALAGEGGYHLTMARLGNESRFSVLSLRERGLLLLLDLGSGFRLFTMPSLILTLGLPGGSDGEASAYNAGDLGSVPGLGRSPGEGHDNPLQYSCLKNPRDRGAWWATVHGVAKSQTRLSDFTFTFTLIRGKTGGAICCIG